MTITTQITSHKSSPNLHLCRGCILSALNQFKRLFRCTVHRRVMIRPITLGFSQHSQSLHGRGHRTNTFKSELTGSYLTLILNLVLRQCSMYVKQAFPQVQCVNVNSWMRVTSMHEHLYTIEITNGFGKFTEVTSPANLFMISAVVK